MAAERRRLTEPLESTTWLFGVWMALLLVASAVATGLGTGSGGGFGPDICETLARTSLDTGKAPVRGGTGARPAAALPSLVACQADAAPPTIRLRRWAAL